LAAVRAADGSSLEPAVSKAISDFIVGCKADGIWSAIKASCILMGARTLSGALTPLVGTAPTNFNFVSGDYNRKTGLIGDGSTKSMNSNRAENADPATNSHLAMYVTEANTLNARSYFRTGNSYWIGYTSGGQDVAFKGAGTSSPNALVTPTIIAASRGSSSECVLRKNGSSITAAANSNTPLATGIRLYARENNTQYSGARASFYSIGELLDLALLDSRVSTLYTAIGAAIP
jgi:hypothetical protein